MGILVLDQDTINKIAAGEVIERPASVVKELIENAIDAKANAITVEIKEGGISFIRITDNGCGIPWDELELAFVSHATSKIKSVEDLMNVSSLGFRGEALASIAAVSQVELITKTKDSFSGCRYVVEGGEKISKEEIGAPDGTTFIVRNLFYNTPVRKKFLKTAATEGGYINALVEHMALSNPNVSFRFINNNQNKLHTSGNGNLKEIIYGIYGRDIANNLIEVNAKTQDLEITGYVGKPLISRGNRTYENYYVNKRYIKSNVLTKAIEEGYRGFVMQHQYPFVALHFNINPNIIDVNVHPTKMELRFSNNEYVYDFTMRTVREALSKRELIPTVSVDNVQKSVSNITKAMQSNYVPRQVAEPVPVKREERSIPDRLKAAKASLTGDMKAEEKVTVKDALQDCNKEEVKKAETSVTVKNTETVEPIKKNGEPVKPVAQARLPEPFEVKRSSEYKQVSFDKVCEQAGLEKYTAKTYEQTSLDSKLLDVKTSQNIKLIGQLFETYWLIEFEEKFFIMDQHAAHEKVLFERIMKNFQEKKVFSQQIQPPMILTLRAAEEDALKKNMEVFEQMGFEIEDFGGNSYKVTALPASLPNIDEKQLLVEMLDALAEDDTKKGIHIVAERVATMACKAAIKGNNRISAIEAKALIDELMTLENPYNCPHGRPTIISMSKYEIEKKFKRIV